MGFVCLANVLWAIRDFALNALSLVGERNFALGLRITGRYCCRWDFLYCPEPLPIANIKLKLITKSQIETCLSKLNYSDALTRPEKS